jgi:purine-binding chemotaxis protein CheW
MRSIPMNLNPRMPVAPDEELQLTEAQVRAILSDRATKLARGYTLTVEPTERQVQLIAFGRGEHRYGVELRFLTEIRPLAAVTRVPGVPPFFSGVIQLRGEIVAVIDIAVLFGGELSDAGGDRFAVVVASPDGAAALLADAVDDVVDLPADQIHPPLATFTQSRERYIRGLTETGLAILDVERLLGDEWLRVDHEPTEERR